MTKQDDAGLALKIVGVLLIFVMCFFYVWASVPAGHRGIYDTFGNVAPQTASPGFHFKAPWTAIVPMNVKTLEIKEESQVPSKEGLIVGLHVSILFHLEPEQAIPVYKTVGQNYPEVIVKPRLRSIIRGVTSEYEAKALYTAGRAEVESKMFNALKPELTARGVVLEAVLLRDLSLPDTVKEAIEFKLEAEQDAERYDFIIQQETKEAERKRIEAQGIADSQAIIDQSLTDQYLTWYWIGNLKEHESVMYVPVGDEGMPLFKNVDSFNRGDVLIEEVDVSE